MREILFRGNRVDNGELVEGFYMILGEKYHYILTGKLDITFGYIDLMKRQVDPSTVGQYTGLTDKNGKKIFDGDICRACLDPEICVGCNVYTLAKILHNCERDVLMNGHKDIYITPEAPRPKGRWEHHTNASAQCSACGGVALMCFNFCPHCGAKMEV